MGIVEEIGEAIGKAFGVLADFIGEAVEKAAEIVLGSLYVAGDLLVKQMLTEVTGSDTEIKTNATALSELMEDQFIDDPNRAINTAIDYEGTLEAGEATRVLQLLYGPIDEHMISGVIFALITEAVSLGQIEGVQNLLAMEDKLKGFSDLASTYRKMQNEVGLFQPYMKDLNARYQNLIPGPGDNVRFALREVWDPTRRSQLLQETPARKYYDRLNQNGFSDEIGDDFWASHWVLPGVGQLNEMLHRRVIDDQTHDDFIRYNDFDPVVRPWLKAISYNPYTRVDARRMYDLSILNEQELHDNYLDLGYDETHAENMTTWTKVFIISGDLKDQYTKGWITKAEVLSRLIAAGMKQDRAEELTRNIVKATGESRIATERDLTKTEIIKGVKKGIISSQDAIDILMDMGYSQEEAEYIVLINVEAAAGSPEVWSEFQDIANKRRAAQGQPVKQIPQQIPDLEQQISRIKKKQSEIKEPDKNKDQVTELRRQLTPLTRRHSKLVKQYRKD
ncbi:MAG: hypothetical protein KAJ10_05230 [Thermodesulfovibrionia bacterium]|nr:hypothetical protein [Thermodesulfovibrionia bacterium]